MTEYQTYLKHCAKVYDLECVMANIQWDQEVCMPTLGAEGRSSQIETLSKIIHNLKTEKQFGDLLNQLLENDLNTIQKKNIELSKKYFDRNSKYTEDFVGKSSKLTSESFLKWSSAKNKNDYEVFKNHLQKMVDLKIEESEILGYSEHPYDAHLELFEPGLTTSKAKVVFDQVQREIIPIAKRISQLSPVNNDFMYHNYSDNDQWTYSLDLLKRLGYNFERGRQDKANHPFTIGLGQNDIRITTRVNENDLSEIIWSSIHEVGHALYELSINNSDKGTPTNQYCSMSIHESQSRLYENNLGRSAHFWKQEFDHLKSTFPEQLGAINDQSFYKGMNRVENSLIRTSADEITYHLHILVRFEMERELISGELNAEDAKDAWNTKYKNYLGITPPDDASGILQDVHWSQGLFGYFPTYSLGSFYAAQFYAKAWNDEIVSKNITQGNYQVLLNWLNEKIHQKGRLQNAEALCQEVTGEALDLNHFIDYIKAKYQEIYSTDLTNI
jgi:carboxypeptidase Taq